MQLAPLFCLFGLCTGNAPAETAAQLTVLTDFSGGSAKVEKIDQETRTVTLRPGSPAERGWVCWWYCKVEGIKAGETVTLEVVGSGFTTPERAFFSLDDKHWTQTGPGERAKDRTVYKQKVGGKEAWFAWGPPFVLRDAEELVARLAKESKHVKPFQLCKSKEGRAVPGLHVEQEGATEAERLGVWVQARQHAWESGGSWVCHGFVEWLVSDDPRAEALRKRARVTIIPVMDVDNVERGAGGKDQKPHDRNRDWSDTPVWPEVAAAIKHITEMDKAGRFDFFIDLHNPGPGDRQPFFFIPDKDRLDAIGRRNMDSFLQAARGEITGPLKLAPNAKETGPAYDKNWEKISGNWVKAHTRAHVVACCLETAWNTPQSTAENYRRAGKELGLAIERYLREPVRPAKE